MLPQTEHTINQHFINMVRHVVMWKFKPVEGKTPKEIAEDIKEQYQSIMGLVPGLKSVEVGINRNDSATAYDAILIEDFDSWKDLAEYKADPMRDKVAKFAEQFVDIRARVEYER